eukprot:12910095-Heterocapsa_arctica.AAC.1
MMLHTKNDKDQHCYTLKYWPNKGVVMIKAPKELYKRKWNELDFWPEDKKPQGWGKAAEKGGSHNYASGSAWSGDTRGSPARPAKDTWK